MVAGVEKNPDLSVVPAPRIAALAEAVAARMAQAVVGKPEAIRATIATFFAGGHLLIEDVPGLGKTTLAVALARSFEVSSARIQGTADLLPADITGVSVYDQAAGEFRFHRGPIFASVVVADELNRATPRAQSALLEAMGEGSVSVEGRTLPLSDPFFVIATQNPVDMEGTFPLPEAQRDRFTARMTMGYPGPADEAAMLLGDHGLARAAALEPVANAHDARLARYTVSQAHVEAAVAEYVVALAAATRADARVRLGASPRAGVQLLAMAKAHAVMDGRDYVTPHDVAVYADAVLAHRLLLHSVGLPEEDAQGTAREVVAKALATIRPRA